MVLKEKSTHFCVIGCTCMLIHRCAVGAKRKAILEVVLIELPDTLHGLKVVFLTYLDVCLPPWFSVYDRAISPSDGSAVKSTTAIPAVCRLSFLPPIYGTKPG